MQGFTDVAKNKMLDHQLKEEVITVALFSDDVEITAPEYQRQEAKFTLAENGQTVNENDIFFPIAQSTWGRITEVAMYDSEDQLIAKMSPERIKIIDAGSQYHIPKKMIIARMI